MKPEKNFPYKTGDHSYNRESGRKTLMLVTICLVLVVILSFLSLYMIINRL